MWLRQSGTHLNRFVISSKVEYSILFAHLGAFLFFGHAVAALQTLQLMISGPRLFSTQRLTASRAFASAFDRRHPVRPKIRDASIDKTFSVKFRTAWNVFVPPEASVFSSLRIS